MNDDQKQVERWGDPMLKMIKKNQQSAGGGARPRCRSAIVIPAHACTTHPSRARRVQSLLTAFMFLRHKGPPNRFNIPPVRVSDMPVSNPVGFVCSTLVMVLIAPTPCFLQGYRWDGVVRGNGFESKMMRTGNEKAVRDQEAYAWSTEDM